MHKAIKNKSNPWKALRAALALLILVFISWKVMHFDLASFGQLSVFSPLLLVASFLLSPVNWGLEYLKFRLLARRAGSDADGAILSRAFFAGILSAFLTPNMTGNFIGRMLYFRRPERPAVIVYSLLANGSQLLVTLLFGLLALSFQAILSLQLSTAVAWGLFPLSLATYYFFEHLVPGRGKRALRFRQMLHGTIGLRSAFLGISALRYIVFLGQFSLMICAFYPSFSPGLIPVISLLYLFMTFTPGLFFGKVLVRETVAVWLLGLFAVPDAVSLSAAFLVWVANLALPCLLGLVIVQKPVRIRA